MSTDIDTNIAKEYFDNFHAIADAVSRPLTNIYWSYASRSRPTYGTLYLIHGYGGSPIEPCLKLPMCQAQDYGFDIVAIEGTDLSATSGTKKFINNMTLARQKQALDAGLRYAATIPNLNTAHKIAWVHSISCRALAELVVDNINIRNYFSDIVLNNPYFLIPPKVQRLHDSMLARDPSGKMWHALIHKSSNRQRCIENHTFKIPTCLNNLYIPLPQMWGTPENVKLTTRKIAHFVSKMRMYCVLGTADDMADYHQNLNLMKNLPVPHKQLISINGANHSFENAQNEYMQFAKIVINSIRTHVQ